MAERTVSTTSASAPLYGSSSDMSADTGTRQDPDSPPYHTLSENHLQAFEISRLILSLLHVVALNRILPICPDTLSKCPQQSDKSGKTKTVCRYNWKGQEVCVKACSLPPLRTFGPTQVSKIARKYRAFLADIISEVKILSHSSIAGHPNIVGITGLSFLEPESPFDGIDAFRPVLVLEASEQQYPDLHDFLQNEQRDPVSWDIASSLATGIARALAWIQLHGIQHADLTDRNILIFRNGIHLTPKLSDFGSSGISNSFDDITGCPPPSWPGRAPELCEQTSSTASQASDIYSFGLLCALIFLDGKRPWTEEEFWRMKSDPDDPLPGYLQGEVRKLGVLGGTPDRLEALEALFSGTLRKAEINRSPGVEALASALTSEPPSSFAPAPRHARHCRPFKIISHVSSSQVSTLPTHTIEMEWIVGSIMLEGWAEGNKTLVPQKLVCEIFQACEPMVPTDWRSPFWFQTFLSEVEVSGGGTLELPREFSYQVITALNSLFAAYETKDQVYKREFPRLYSVLEAYYVRQSCLFRRLAISTARIREVDCSETHTFIPQYQRSVFGSSDLHHAVLTGDTSNVQTLLAMAKDPYVVVNTVVGPWHTSPLHLACRVGASDIAKVLLEHGADITGIELHDQFKMTPLAYAIFNKHIELINVLLAWSCSMRKAQVCCLRQLRFTCEADVWFTNPAMRAGGHFVHDLGTMKSLPIYEMLMKHDPELVHAREPRGKTPLHRAAEYLQLDVAKLLVKYGADVNARDQNGFTPLHKAYAALGGYTGLASVSHSVAEDMKEAVGHSTSKARTMIEYLHSEGAIRSLADYAGRYPHEFQYPVLDGRYVAKGWRFWAYYGIITPLSWATKPFAWAIRLNTAPVRLIALTGLPREQAQLLWFTFLLTTKALIAL